MFDIHAKIAESEDWWIRALDGTLSPEEAHAWRQHLALCSKCYREWQALTQVDWLLRTAPPPPQISEGFTVRTMQRLEHKQRQRRLLNSLGGLVIVFVVTLVTLNYFGMAFGQLDQLFSVLWAGRGILLEPLLRLVTGCLVAGRRILPIALGLAGALLLLMMPNGILATYAVVLLSRRRYAAQPAYSFVDNGWDSSNDF